MSQFFISSTTSTFIFKPLPLQESPQAAKNFAQVKWSLLISQCIMYSAISAQVQWESKSVDMGCETHLHINNWCRFRSFRNGRESILVFKLQCAECARFVHCAYLRIRLVLASNMRYLYVACTALWPFTTLASTSWCRDLKNTGILPQKDQKHP